MNQKHLFFLSDECLFDILKGKMLSKQLTLDPTFSTQFIQKQQQNIWRKRMFGVFFMIVCVVILVSVSYLFQQNLVSEGGLGLISTCMFIGILMMHYFIFPKHMQIKRTKQEYLDTINLVIKKSGTHTQPTPEDVFNTLILRMGTIAQEKPNTQTTQRICTILEAINAYEDVRGEILKVEPKVLPAVEEIASYFQNLEDCPLFETFKKRRSMSTYILAKEWVEEKKEEEIFA